MDDGLSETTFAPGEIDLEAATRFQTLHRAVTPGIWQRRQQEEEAVVTLKEHLGNACRTAEVAVDLERRMGVEEVRISAAPLLHGTEDEKSVGGERQLVLNEFVSVVAVEQTCPRTDLPTHAPAGRDIAASLE